MKKLYLVRHAKSSWKFPELTDAERPLNKRGKRDVPRMGEFLANKGVQPDLLISSPANRAFTTAKGIAESLQIPMNRIEVSDNVYHAGSGSLLNVVGSADNSIKTLMLFGHNPGFTDFANQLANTNIFNVPTCGVVAIRFEVSSWSDITFGSGVMENFWYPKGI